MTDQQLVTDIRNRFRFTANDVRRGLASYEYDLIYEIYPKEKQDRILRVMKEYADGILKAFSTNKKLKESNNNRGIKDVSVIF